MACNTCTTLVSSDCLVWEGDKTLGSDLHTIISSLTKSNSPLEVDVKTLSEEETLTNEELIQLLVDKIIQLELQVAAIDTDAISTTMDCAISIGSVTSNNICTVFQYVISEINGLKAEVNALKNNEYM